MPLVQNATIGSAALAPPRQRLARDEWLERALLIVIALWLLCALLLPLYTVAYKSLQDAEGTFVGVENYVRYFNTPALVTSIQNSLFVATLVTVITISLAFPFAYAITRSCMPYKGVLKAVALVKLLAPGMLPAISVRYLFGNQGMLNWMMGDYSIYGPIGIVIGQVIFTFPFALLILSTALSTADARLYEAALMLGAGKPRIFFSVTLPGAKYGLVSSAFMVFTLAITDFTVPKITGGQYNVLATDVYKQVVGQQNFEMGAVVGVILLIPAAVAFAIDRLVQRKQQATLTADAVPYVPKPNMRFDMVLLGYCVVIALLMVAILGVSVYASFIQYWPYNLNFTLANYDFKEVNDQGWGAYFNSLELSAWTAVVGTIIVFCGAYLVEKGRGVPLARGMIHLLSIMPLAVPGLVLGISYIFFFISPENPLNFLYGTMAILVVSTVIHYYPVSHLIAVTALKQMDKEFESISASLSTPFYKTFWRVTVPVCLPAILDISMFFFVNAMTTTSAVVFLYSSDTLPASVSILNMDESGAIASAAAMSIVIVVTSAAVRALHLFIMRNVTRRTQAWRQR